MGGKRPEGTHRGGTGGAVQLKDAVDLDAVRDDPVGVVQTALEPAHVSVWLSGPD